MQLSAKDAAGVLGVSEKTIYRWIKEGLIPVYQINEQYRFNRAELLEWATSRRLRVSPSAFVEEPGDLPLPTLTEALTAGRIVYRVAGTDKPSVLRAVVSVLNLPQEVDREFLYQVLLARESLGSTGIGDGIAIPHVRNPVILHVVKPTVTLCFLENPIDFKSIDAQPVRILFTLVSPSVQTHLHLLSRLGYVLQDPILKSALKQQAPPEELSAALSRAETAIPVTTRQGGIA